MPTPALQLLPHLPLAELKRRSDTASNANQRAAWLALWLLARGYRPTQVAPIVNVSRSTLLRWLQSYNEAGDAWQPPRSPLAGRSRKDRTW